MVQIVRIGDYPSASNYPCGTTLCGRFQGQRVNAQFCFSPDLLSYYGLSFMSDDQDILDFIESRNEIYTYNGLYFV